MMRWLLSVGGKGRQFSCKYLLLIFIFAWSPIGPVDSGFLKKESKAESFSFFTQSESIAIDSSKNKVGTAGNSKTDGSSNVGGNLKTGANSNVGGNSKIIANSNVGGNSKITTNSNVGGNLKISANSNVGADLEKTLAFPSLVQIRNKDEPLCSAVIVTSEWILTAAHCLLTQYAGDYFILAGDRDRDKDEDSEQESIALKLVPHENYNEHTMEDDIALVQVLVPFDFTLEVQAALLPKKDFEVKGQGQGQPGSLWTGDFSNILQPSKAKPSNLIVSASVPAVDGRACLKFLPNNATGSILSDKKFCAGPSKKEACLGSSGGPIYHVVDSKQTVVGINVWDEGCARMARPTIYTKVAKYVQWIETTMKTERVDQPPKATRVVGGWDSLPYKYPSLVLLRIQEEALCAGTILNAEWVVTAAHCVISKDPSDFVYVAAEFNKDQFEGPEQSVTVTHIYVHEKYNGPTHENDIAVMRVYPSFQFNAKVQPVNLPPKDYQPKDQLWVTGWGAIAEGGRSPSILQELDLEVTDGTTCKKDVNIFPAVMICSGYMQGGYDSCQGDSGGPLYLVYRRQHYLMGVVSWGVGCGRSNKPGVYTRVPAFVDWIQKKISAAPAENNWFVQATGQVRTRIYNGSSAETRIVGGKTAGKYLYTSLVVLKFQGLHICSGTILSEEWVVTAAHCLRSDHAADFQLVAGEYDRSKVEGFEQTVQVISIIKHPGYNTDTQENDISLFKVKPAFKFNDKVKAVTLPAENFVAKGTMWLAGWGVTKYGGFVSPDLLQDVDVPVVDPAKCEQLLKGDEITELQLCAGWEGGKKDACQGDSGGPLYQVKGKVQTIVGVVSWGRGCALKNSPGVYTRVSAYLNWINQYIYTTNFGRLGRRVLPVALEGNFEGDAVDPNSFPSVVLIKARHQPICTGVIIAQDWVLTSADCVDADSATSLEIIAGKHDSSRTESTEQSARVTHLFWHANYSSSLHLNDIAMLKVWPPFELNENVAPAKLPKQYDPVTGDMRTVTVGWPDKGNSTALLELRIGLKTRDLAKCPPSTGQICVGRSQTGDRGCYGDPGGPLFSTRVLIGIVAGNTGCFVKHKLGIFTNVGHYLDWIQERMDYVNSDPANQLPKRTKEVKKRGKAKGALKGRLFVKGQRKPSKTKRRRGHGHSKKRKHLKHGRQNRTDYYC